MAWFAAFTVFATVHFTIIVAHPVVLATGMEFIVCLVCCFDVTGIIASISNALLDLGRISG